eukprot:IDg18638t1
MGFSSAPESMSTLERAPATSASAMS